MSQTVSQIAAIEGEVQERREVAKNSGGKF